MGSPLTGRAGRKGPDGLSPDRKGREKGPDGLSPDRKGREEGSRWARGPGLGREEGTAEMVACQQLSESLPTVLLPFLLLLLLAAQLVAS